MKRYSVFGIGLAEDPAGNWVKFAEVEEIEALAEMAASYRDRAVAAEEKLRDIGTDTYSTRLELECEELSNRLAAAESRAEALQVEAAIKAAGGTK